MKRKVALLMATLMAGSSLSGSYVSAASIEGRSEENVQSEETASENEDAGASELAESEIPLENETSQEEEEIQQAEDQEEDIEFHPEESVVLDEELYAEEEQFIEAEPVPMLMEDGEESIQDVPEDSGGENGQNGGYDYRNLDLYPALLSGESYDIPARFKIGIWSEDGECTWQEANITKVQVTEGQQNLMYDGSETSDLVPVSEEDNQYHMEVARNIGDASARLEITWESAEGEDKKISGSCEAYISIAGERYVAGYEFASGDGQLLPGQSVNIITSLTREWYDVEEDEQHEEEITDYTIEWTIEEDGPEGLIDVIEDPDHNKNLCVTAHSSGYAEIKLHYLYNGNDVQQESIDIYVSDGIYLVKPGYLIGENEESLNPHVGDTLDLAAAQIETYRQENGSDDEDKIEDVRYRVEYDSNAWKPEEGQEDAISIDEPGVIHGLPRLQRTGNWRTEITVYAEKNVAADGEEEDWQDIAKRTYRFGEWQYWIEFNEEEDPVLFYGDRSEPLTITADTSNLEEKGLKGYEIIYEVEQYTDGQKEELTCATKTTNKGSCTLQVNDDFTTEDAVWLHVRAVARNHGIEIAFDEIDISVEETELNLGSLPQDTTLLPGWGHSIDSQYQVWRRDSKYPNGEDVTVTITDVEIESDKEKILSENEDGEKIWIGEDGNYHLNIISDNTRPLSGVATIRFHYEEAGESEESDTAMLLSGDEEFTITLASQKYNTAYEYETGTDQMLPGSEMVIRTSLFRESYNIDDDEEQGEEIEDYTIELQESNVDGTSTWNTDLIDVEIDSENAKNLHVTAKMPEEYGYTEIPVHYLIGDEKVGMEWIPVGVFDEVVVIKPETLEDNTGKSINPFPGETLNLKKMGIQTYRSSSDGDYGEVTDIRYRVEYDPNVWKLDSEQETEENGVVYGLPVLRRIAVDDTEIRVIAERKVAEDGEEEHWMEIARRPYWFDRHEYHAEYAYSMSEEELGEGRIYTDDVPLYVNLIPDQEMPENAEVKWQAVIYDENEEAQISDWIKVTSSKDAPYQASVTWVDGVKKDSYIDSSFQLRASITVGGKVISQAEDWIGVWDTEVDFPDIQQMFFFTGATDDPRIFDSTETFQWYQENGTYPSGRTDYVTVTDAEEECEEGEAKHLVITKDSDGNIKIAPKENCESGETSLKLYMAYEDGSEAGSWNIKVQLDEKLTGLDDLKFNSPSGRTQLLPGQTLRLTPTVVTYVRKDGEVIIEKTLKENTDYIVNYEFNTDNGILEYDEETCELVAKKRGSVWVEMQILDAANPENVISSFGFEVLVSGRYYTAEILEQDATELNAGGPAQEILFNSFEIMEYTISNPDGAIVSPSRVREITTSYDSVIAEMDISSENAKIQMSLLEENDLVAGESRAEELYLTFWDQRGEYMDEVPYRVILHRHDLKAAAYKPATCTESGNQAYWTCDCCGKVYEDATGQNETTIANQKINASGHSMEQTPAQAATCITEGTEGYWTCQNCHQVFADQAGMNVTTIEAQKTAKTAHSYGAYTVTKKATVLAEGEEAHTCTVCGRMESRTTAKLTGTMRLTANRLPLQVKKTVQLSRIVTDLADGDYIVSCTSQNPKAATVDNHGKVKAKAAGSTVITIQLASGVTAKVTINVQKKTVTTSSIGNVSKSWNAKSGEKLQLSPVISPITTTDKVTYTSSNKKVATVSGKGLITAKKAGTAKITVKSGKKKFTVTVKVAAPQPTGINSVPAAKALKKGKSFTIKPKLTPSGAQGKISYSTSNKKVVAVNAKGKVTAKGAGTAVITVKAGNITKTCTVTVK